MQRQLGLVFSRKILNLTRVFSKTELKKRKEQKSDIVQVND
mgnify:CR=1 FL=1